VRHDSQPWGDAPAPGWDAVTTTFGGLPVRTWRPLLAGRVFFAVMAVAWFGLAASMTFSAPRTLSWALTEATVGAVGVGFLSACYCKIAVTKDTVTVRNPTGGLARAHYLMSAR
jgi:uncharacterized MnhB-related membrane protein